MQNPSVSATVYLRTESNYLVPRGDISVYQIMHWMRQQWSHTLEDPKADRTKSNTQAEVSRSKQTNKQTKHKNVMNKRPTETVNSERELNREH